MEQISVEVLHKRLAEGWSPVILDVREDWEYEICHLEQSVHISMSTIAGSLEQLDRDDELVVLCHHGSRSAQVASFLNSCGFTKVTNLDGGIDAWASIIDPSMSKY